MRTKKLLLIPLLVVFSVNIIVAQNSITGSVMGPDGKGLQSVSVSAPNSAAATITDANGHYRITVPADVQQLEFSSVGFQQQTLSVAGKSSVNVSLQATSGSLADVVVVGYGTQRKRDVTGTISSVKGDDIKNLPVSNSATALQGRASGVDIVRSDGAPGSIPSIRIRGTGTINNSDPLVVIDGVPSGSLNDVNPNDIASIEILKDASSSAIYGTRAANGVVLITTKKGSYGDQMMITANVYTGTSSITKKLDLLTAPELALLKKEQFANDGTPVPAIWNDSYYSTQRTDWQDALYGTGKTNNADVALRGGSAKARYSLSANYFDDRGIITSSYFKRISTSFNSEYKVGNRIRIGQNFIYSSTNNVGPNTRSSQDGLVWSALRFNPAIPVHNDDGSYGSSKADNELGDINNPVFTVENADAKNQVRRVLASAYAEVELLKGLSIKANYGFDLSTNDGYSFAIATPNQTRVNPLATLTQSHGENTSYLQEIFLNYSRALGDHTMALTAGYSAQTFASNYYYAQRRGFTDPADDHRILDNGSSDDQRSGGTGNNKPYAGLQSYFARGNYAYKAKYLLTATIRADGSSKFPPGKRWGYFPAVSAGWRLSEEGFFKKNIAFINSLKLTGGWGQLGNQNIADFQYLANIRSGGNGTLYSFGTAGNVVNGSYIVNLANPTITWERAEMTNISLELGLLRNHLTGTLTYFNKDTKDMLIPYSLVENYGANVSVPGGNITVSDQNIGTLNNKGIEVDITYRNTAGRFTYSIAANAAFIKNKVTHLYGTRKDYISSARYGRQSLETSRTYEGQPIASFYGFKTNGLYQNQGEIDKDANVANDNNRQNIKPGDVRFTDIDADGKITDADRIYLGDPNPKTTLGLNGSLGFKNFDLNFSFAGALGFELYNADRFTGLDATQVFNLYKESLNRWHGEGTSNTVPRVTRTNSNLNYRSSDLWIEKGDYLSLKNVSLGYSIFKWKIAGSDMPATRVYISCYNAFIITGYSGYTPELGYTDGNRQRGVDVAQYPPVRTFTAGVTINL